MLIKGEQLTPRQRQLVLAAFVHRHYAVGDGKHYTSDDAWIRDPTFYFVKDGSRLSYKHKRCEPQYLAG